MEKIGTKVLMYALLSVVLMQFSGLVGAVNIQFYPSTSACSGSGAVGCYNVGPNVCCYATTAQGGSVLFNSAGSNDLSYVYRNGGCKTYVGTGPGKGNICYVGGSFTGASYSVSSRRRSLLSSSSECDTQMKPDSVFYTKNSADGYWVLTSSDADIDDLYSQMQTVPDAEKENWMESHGGIFNQEAV